MKHLFYAALLIALLPSYSFSESWTVCVTMDSSDDMNDMAIKNIYDLMSATPHRNVTFALQLHAFGTTAYRYIVKRNALVPAGIVNLTDNRLQNFVDGALWAFNSYPADHFMLLVWNHGSGCLEPQWDESAKDWRFEPDDESEANHLDPDELFETVSSCTRARLTTTHRLWHRGYLFSLTPREYLTNNDLVQGLEKITTALGRTFDIVCFDTCMGAMLENGYQCAPFAQYLVGVQSCAAKDGLNYGAFGEVFGGPYATPSKVAKALVATFADYYTTQTVTDLDSSHEAKGIFTLTAIDLAKVNALKESLDLVVTKLQACTAVYGIKPLRKAFRTAHSKCYTLCLFSMYIDLYSLLSFFNSELDVLAPSEQLTALKQALTTTCSALTDAVTAHCCGPTLQGKAHGISIYCPHYHVDSTYATTLFGKTSLWQSVLQWETGESISTKQIA